MSNYNFHDIFEPYEFQEFARDMIQARDGITFETFAMGRDSGIDGRHVAADGTVTILQAKRWQEAPVIKWEELKEEREKLKMMRTDRYILVFSRSLSPGMKQKIIDFFHPYILSEKDVVSRGDLNNWLSDAGGKFEKVEEKYFKLWLPNTPVLKRVLQDVVNSALLEESDLMYNWALEGAKVFVETRIYEKALKQLERNRVIIISGEPGIGKTTLACQLALYYHLRKGFETFLWANQVEDLYKASSMPGKKVVIFDDFWGSTLLEHGAAGRDEERLSRFIELNYRKADLILILTTREYLLEKVLSRQENLRRQIEKHKLECRLSAYSRGERARIYFGHLKRWSLNPVQMRQLFNISRSVVSSPNYNPRVIELFMKDILPDVDEELCGVEFLHYLEFPEDFWKKIYHDLSGEAKAFYMILYLLPRPVTLNCVRECFMEMMPLLGASTEHREFGSVTAELEKTVIRTDCTSQKEVIVRFQNPSAGDFMEHYLAENLEQHRELLLAGCCYVELCIDLMRMMHGKQGQENYYCRVMKKAIELMGRPDQLSQRTDTRGAGIEAADYYDRGTGWYNRSEWIIFFDLFVCYDDSKCGQFRDYFQSGFQTYFDTLRLAPWNLLAEEIKVFPQISAFACRAGLVNEVKMPEMIEAYMNAVMRLRLPMDPGMGMLYEIWEDKWTGYKEKHRGELASYFERYYRTQLCLEAARGNALTFKRQMDNAEYAFKDVLMAPHREFLEAVDRFAAWIDPEDDIEAEEEDEEEWDDQDEEFDQAVKQFKEEFFYLGPTTVFEPGNYIENSELEEAQKEQLRRINEEGPWFWNIFLGQEESMSLMFSIIRQFGALELEFSDALKQIFTYLGTRMGCREEEAADVFFRLAVRSEGKNGIPWTEQVLADVTGEQLHNLVSDGVFILKNERYYLSGSDLLLYSGFYRFLKRNEWRTYRTYRFLLAGEPDSLQGEGDAAWATFVRVMWEYRIKQGGYEWFLGFLECDREGFWKKGMVPAIQRYIGRIKGNTEKETCLNLMRDMKFELDVEKSGDITGSSVFYGLPWEGVELAAGISCHEVFPDCFTEEEMALLAEADLLDFEFSDENTISFKELEINGLLQPLGFFERAAGVIKRLEEAIR